MVGSGAGIRAIISLVDRVSGPLKAINRALRQPIRAIREVGAASAGLGQSISGALAPVAGISSGLAVTFGTLAAGGIVKTGAQFENFQTVLETVEGSSEKARASMNWVADFAKKTPYQLAEVNGAFVQLRAYGLDPTNGLLRTLGDASAGMGKQIGDAVEMMADAVRGENERLKEFGVVGEKAGNEIVYRWDYNGKQMVTKAKNNSKDIQKALSGIFDKKFGGAMDKLSRTMSGLWSNIQDTVTGVYRQIGDAGVFDAIKFELQNILNLLNGWQDDGTIKAVAQTISDVLVDAIWSVWAALAAIDWQQVWSDIRSFAAAVMAGVDAIGGWQNALIGVAIIMNLQTIAAAASLIGAVGSLGVALWGLAARIWMQLGPALVALGQGAVAAGARILAGMVPALLTAAGAFGAAVTATWAWTAALLANPIGLIIAGIVAVAGAAYLIYENWGAVAGWWSDVWRTIVTVFDGAVAVIVGLLSGDLVQAGDGLRQMMTGLVDFILAAWQPVIGLFETIRNWMGGEVTVPEIPAQPNVSGSPNVSVPPAVEQAAREALRFSDGDGSTDTATQRATPLYYGDMSRSSAGGDGIVNRGQSPVLAAASNRQQPVQGEITVTFENTPPGTRVEGGGTNQPGFGLNPDVGYRRFGVI